MMSFHLFLTIFLIVCACSNAIIDSNSTKELEVVGVESNSTRKLQIAAISAILGTVSTILENLDSWDCLDYDTRKEETLRAAKAQIIQNHGTSEAFFVGLIHDNNANGYNLECGCRAWDHHVSFCGTGYRLVTIAGNDASPCRFKYSGDMGEYNLENVGFNLREDSVFWIGGYCDNYPAGAGGNTEWWTNW